MYEHGASVRCGSAAAVGFDETTHASPFEKRSSKAVVVLLGTEKMHEKVCVFACVGCLHARLHSHVCI